MNMLERNSEHTERSLSSEGKGQKDIRPPKEIGETKNGSADIPKEIAKPPEKMQEVPRELDDRNAFHTIPAHDVDNPKQYTDDAEQIKTQKETDCDKTEMQFPEKTIIQTKNQELEGKQHPITGVRFERKSMMVDGEIKEGVFAQFDSQKDVHLPKELYKDTDKKQFDYCNQELKESIQNDIELRSKFTKDQIEQIMNGDTPDGYVWHHNEEPGKMQLINQETHQKTGHTGGKVVWGGGSENR